VRFAAVQEPGLTRLSLGLAALVAIAVLTLTFAGVRLRTGVVTASLRAAAQLTVVGLVIRGVFAAPAASVAVLAVMYAVSVGTAARRVRDLPGVVRAVALASLAGLLPVLAVSFAVPIVPRSTRYLVALGGIVLGNTMTACTLSGRGLAAGMRTRRDEIEGWLALGATPRQACVDVVRHAVREALLPGLDQTRTVGLVTLPGAFVGALAGGASAGSAARFQLVVLIAIVAAQALSATVLTALLGAPATLPEPEQTARR
jgi:putative ABC transport system permease protein